jgi:glutamine synthetase
MEILKGYVEPCKAIVFEGNGYSDDWVAEAEKRGLSHIKHTPDALATYISKASIELFDKYKIYTEIELHARYEIELENYIKKIQIESRVIGDLAMNHIVSTALKYQSSLVENVKGQKEIGIDPKYFFPTIETIKKIAQNTAKIQTLVDQMTEARRVANIIENVVDRAQVYCKKIKPYFEEIRYCVDKLELIVDNDEWPLVKYRELLLIR